MIRRNLVLIHRGPGYARDFSDIGRKVIARDPSIAVFHLPVKLKAELPAEAWSRPTLTVALSRDFVIPIRRGPILRNRPIGKLEQQEIFRRNAIPTPAALPFRPGMRLDPAVFGDFVVVKPLDLGATSHGGVRLFRRARLETMTEAGLAPDDPLLRRPGAHMVQRFVASGRRPRAFRVQTFLGRALYCYEMEILAEQPPLTSADAELDRFIVASNAAERSRTLVNDEAAIRLAEAAHAALPDIPILGIDMIREEGTGELFVLECNAGGNTWHFTSEIGSGVREYLGRFAPEPVQRNDIGRQMLIGQFGAFDIAAEVLVRKTAELAG